MTRKQRENGTIRVACVRPTTDVSFLSSGVTHVFNRSAMRRRQNTADRVQRWILHLDVDSFYVTCERLRRRDLINKPYVSSARSVAPSSVVRRAESSAFAGSRLRNSIREVSLRSRPKRSGWASVKETASERMDRNRSNSLKIVRMP